jgi:hypothetical protein
MSLTPEQQRALTEDLVSLTYEELRRIAHNYFRNHRPGLTLRPTEVVDEACMQLIERSQENWQDSQHFRAIAARKIWQVIVDEIRKRQAKKRGGAPQQRPEADNPDAPTVDQRWRRIPLDTITVAWHNREIELIDLADALDELAAKHARLGEVVEAALVRRPDLRRYGHGPRGQCQHRRKGLSLCAGVAESPPQRSRTA